MLRIKRSTLLISIAIMIAMVAVACEAAVEKPAVAPTEIVPPTAIPTVTDDSASSVTESDLAGRAGGGNLRGAALEDPIVQECLADQLGLDLVDESGEFDRTAFRTIDPEDVTAAFEACGIDQGTRPQGGGGGFLGGLAGGGFADPEIRECLTAELGDDFADNLGGGSGLGLTPESLAAFEECGLNFGDASGAFGGRDGGGGGFGGFGGRLGGGGFGGFLGGDGSFQECMNAELGEGGLAGLRDLAGGDGPTPELQAALEKCGDGLAIPTEPDGGIGDGAGPLVESTATPIPVSDLTIEQLTCLSGALEPADLANAVIATSAGDLSEVTDDVLAALQDCGVGI